MLTAAIWLSMADVRLHVCAFARLRNLNIREATLTTTAIKSTAVRSPISRRDLDVMMATAAAHSRKLGRSLKLSRAEQDDVEQDILVALLERWHYFDDRRGSNIGFAIRLARQAVQSMADRIAAGWQTELISLEEAAPRQEWGTDDASWISELVGDEAVPDETGLLGALSLRNFNATLPDELALVVNAVIEADGCLPEAQKISSLSASEFHRRLRELRYRLVSLEIAPRTWLNRL